MKAVSRMMLTLLLTGMFLIFTIEPIGAQACTVHFICYTMNRGNQGSITFAGTTYQSGQSASYSASDYWITANPPSPTTDWFFYRWSVMWIGSQSWVDNQYAQSTWFHLRGEVYLEADFYSPIHTNNPTSPITWGTQQRITGTGTQYSGQQLTVVYYPQGSGMGPPNPNGVPPFGGSGYYWTTVTVSSGSWDTGLIYPTLPISLGQQLPQTYDVYACWASGSDNEVDSNVVSFTLNPASAQIVAPALTPNPIELGQSVTVTDQIFSSAFVNSNDLTGTLTVQAKKQGEGSWTDVASQSFTSSYGYSSVYSEWGVFYDLSKTWTPTETGTYDVRVVYSGNNYYLPINNPPTSTLTVTEGNNPPSTPTTPQWITSEQILIGTPTSYEGFGSQATDPEGNDIKVTFDWGDGNSDTTGWLPSGSTAEAYHSWTYPGMFEIKTKATDIHSAESSWSSPLEVTVVTNRHNDIWAGYMVESPTEPVTSVEGRWYVPEFGTEFYGFQGIWVGIGGNGPWSPLLQAGVKAVTRPDIGDTHYCVFVEWIHPIWWWLNRHYADDPSRSGCHISAGDAIRAKISERPSKPGDWDIEVEDISAGWTWHTTITFSPDQTTAEWIFEPGGRGTNIASSFGPITFGETTVEIDSTVYEMGKVGHSLGVNLYHMICIRDGETCTYVSPISNYKIFQILDTGDRPAPSLQPITSISLLSSADLHVYDSFGNHLGYNSTIGLVDLQIPNSMYFEDQGVQYALLFSPEEYQIDLVGRENGDFHLHTQIVANETVTLDQWVNETIAIDETKTYYLIHQVSLQDLVSSKTVIGQGYNCSISVVVFNNGNYTETFNVTAYANTTIIGTQLVTLARGNSTTLIFTWNTIGVPYGNYTINANATIVPGETDTTDNNKTDGWVVVTRKGDVNGDGSTNVIDIILCCINMGPAPPNPPEYDVNGDGTVNVTDILLCCVNMG